MGTTLLLASVWLVAALGASVDAFEVPRQVIREPNKPRSSQAYVTLLYGDEFLLGVRVLGKSIRDTGTTRDLAILVSDGVSMDAVRLLEADGWIVERTDLVGNPNKERPARFWGVYTKLRIFNMTQYEKVVYLDADTIVIKNIDDLFLCQKFCANLKHSERLNSGVMVVEPSKELFEDMVKQIPTLESYTGGDQGFLNSYYVDFPNAELFDPGLPPEKRKPKAMERLSTLYNADVGLYMLANKWMVDGSQLRVVHYTLGPLKPWDWWTEWLLKPVDLWQDVRRNLDSTLPGTGGGLTARNRLAVTLLSVFPIVFVMILIWCRRHPQVYGRSTFPICSYIPYGPVIWSYLSYWCTYLWTRGLALRLHGVSTARIGVLSIVVCFVLGLLSVATSFVLIPRQVMPWTGMLILYEWTFFLFGVIFGKYLDLIYEWGKWNSAPSSLHYSQSKGHSRQSAQALDLETTLYCLGMAFLAILTPCLPFVFGVTALFVRLGVIVAAAMVLVAFVTYSAEHLGTRWFVRGREDALSDH